MASTCAKTRIVLPLTYCKGAVASMAARALAKQLPIRKLHANHGIQVLHQHKDIHLAGESEDEETTELLKEGIRKLKTSIRDRTKGVNDAKAEEARGKGKAEASAAPQIEKD